MNSYSNEFLVKPGSSVDLASIDPASKPEGIDKAGGNQELTKNAEQLEKLQYLLYAENQSSLLICLQGLDAAGKDGTISHVAHSMNPQGTRVHSFKVPSSLEASHDFLWRAHQQAPAKGELVIFNRSHYEDVLVARVHHLVTEDQWEKRYSLINDFEKNLVENGTRILKFFLHIGHDVQLARFEKRLEDPKRQWKISEADYSEQRLWPAYTKAYEAALAKTSTKHAPWFVVPSNHKWVRNLVVSRILVEAMESMNMKTPGPLVDLDDIRRKYHAALERELSTKKPKKADEAH